MLLLLHTITRSPPACPAFRVWSGMVQLGRPTHSAHKRAALQRRSVPIHRVTDAACVRRFNFVPTTHRQTPRLCHHQVRVPPPLAAGLPPIPLCVRSFIYSFYSFEYVWSSQGVDFVTRVDRIERRWPFYLGFGLPVAAAAFFGSRYVNAAAYAIVFPFVRARAISYVCACAGVR